MAITRTPITIHVHREFLALAALHNLKPEFLARMLTDDISLRPPAEFVFKTNRPLEETDALAVPPPVPMPSDGKGRQ